MARTLGALQSAAVKLTDTDDNGKPVVVTIGRGEALPDNLAPGEVERLERAGAFDGPPVARTVTVPEAAVALADYLPPQVTLAANPEPDGGVALVTEEPAEESTKPRPVRR